MWNRVGRVAFTEKAFHLHLHYTVYVGNNIYSDNKGFYSILFTKLSAKKVINQKATAGQFY